MSNLNLYDNLFQCQEEVKLKLQEDGGHDVASILPKFTEQLALKMSKDDFIMFLKRLESAAPATKYTEAFYWPLFKIWFFNLLKPYLYEKEYSDTIKLMSIGRVSDSIIPNKDINNINLAFIEGINTFSVMMCFLIDI